jgi:hypothetical protein
MAERQPRTCSNPLLTFEKVEVAGLAWGIHRQPLRSHDCPASRDLIVLFRTAREQVHARAVRGSSTDCGSSKEWTEDRGGVQLWLVGANMHEPECVGY